MYNAGPRKQVMVVYGTRPEAIKMAPVVQALRASSVLEPVVTLTGQHREIVDEVNGLFRIRPDHDLDAFEAGQPLDTMTARILESSVRVLRDNRPDAVVVQGDTTSTFAAALAAFYERIPVVHLEAGLRTDDIYSPFPEEANRRLTTQVASLHLAPTPASRDNLLRDGVGKERVLVTGNTVIDALLWTVDQHIPYARPELEQVESSRAPVLLVTTHRRESWGRRMRQVAHAIARLARRHPELIVVLPMHPNPVVRRALIPALGGLSNVVLTEPVGYGAFARLLRRANIVLTDSGGIQEEAPSLGKPVLVLRDTTERPEAVSAGTARLVGTDSGRVFGEVDHLLQSTPAYQAMANAVNPYGDGHAARRSVAAIEHLFDLGPRPAPFEPDACPQRAETLAADRGIQRGAEHLGDPAELIFGDHERRRHLQGHAPQQPGDHTPVADVLDEPRAEPWITLPGGGGDIDGAEQAGPGAHLGDEFVPGERGEGSGQRRLELADPADELLASEDVEVD